MNYFIRDLSDLSLSFRDQANRLLRGDEHKPGSEYYTTTCEILGILTIFREGIQSFISLYRHFMDEGVNGYKKQTKFIMAHQLQSMITQLDNGKRFSKHDQRDESAEKCSEY